MCLRVRLRVASSNKDDLTTWLTSNLAVSAHLLLSDQLSIRGQSIETAEYPATFFRTLASMNKYEQESQELPSQLQQFKMFSLTMI